MTDPIVSTSVESGVTTISLKDPAKLNVLSYAICEQLSDAIEGAARSARCVLLRSEGRGFCCGAKLSESPERFADPSDDAGAMVETHLNPLVQTIRALDVPIVAATRAPAAGAGASPPLAWGLISRVVEDDVPEDASSASALNLAAGPNFALGLIRHSCWEAAEASGDATLARERRLWRTTVLHPDLLEGTSAFQEKRSRRFGASNVCQ